MTKELTKLTPEEAALFISDQDTVTFSGFTPAGAPKIVPKAVAARATELHAAGKPFKINVITGASTGWLSRLAPVTPMRRVCFWLRSNTTSAADRMSHT